MAPRKTKTPNIKIEPPPPPPIALDAVGRISVRPPSSLLCSDDEPATKSEPKLATKPPIQLKQQTIMSSYHGAHKAAIIKLLKEDSDIQDTIVNSGWFQSKLKTAVLQLLQSDGDIKIAMNRHAVNRHTKSDTPSFGIESKSDPPPQEETPSKLPEKHTIALDAVGRISVRTPSSLLCSDSQNSYEYLRSHIKTAMTYEEFTKGVVISEADLDYILENGFVDGFTQLILRSLEDLEIPKRPVVSFMRDLTGVYIKVSPTKWKRDVDSRDGGGDEGWVHLREIVFDFAQKVDIKIAEMRDAPIPEKWERDGWNDRLDRIRKQASGGIERIKLISDICRGVAIGTYGSSKTSLILEP